MPHPPVITTDDEVITEIEIAAPPERVFQAITDPEQLMRWWIGDLCDPKLWAIDPRLGGRWRHETKKANTSVNGVTEFKMSGEIIEFDPPRLLAYTWLANWHNDTKRATVVRWELTPTRLGTRLKVTHSGLANEAVARKDYSGGWPGVVVQLKTFVEK